MHTLVRNERRNRQSISINEPTSAEELLQRAKSQIELERQTVLGKRMRGDVAVVCNSATFSCLLLRCKLVERAMLESEI